MVARLHHVSLLVRDAARAMEFYQHVLGLSRIDRPDLGFPGVWLGLGEQQIHLLELPNPDPVEGRPEQGGRDRYVARVYGFTLNGTFSEPLGGQLQGALAQE